MKKVFAVLALLVSVSAQAQGVACSGIMQEIRLKKLYSNIYEAQINRRTFKMECKQSETQPFFWSCDTLKGARPVAKLRSYENYEKGLDFNGADYTRQSLIFDFRMAPDDVQSPSRETFTFSYDWCTNDQ